MHRPEAPTNRQGRSLGATPARKTLFQLPNTAQLLVLHRVFIHDLCLTVVFVLALAFVLVFVHGDNTFAPVTSREAAVPPSRCHSAFVLIDPAEDHRRSELTVAQVSTANGRGRSLIAAQQSGGETSQPASELYPIRHDCQYGT